MSSAAIVLDANILIRAVLGKRVRDLIQEHAVTVKFFAPRCGVCRCSEIPACAANQTRD